MRCLGFDRLAALLPIILIVGSAAPGRAQLRIPSSVFAPTPPPSCGVEADPSLAMAAADAIEMPETDRDIVHVRTVASGTAIRLVGSPGDTQIYRVVVHAKHRDTTQAARLVCKPVLWSPAKGALVASDKRLDAGSLWRIEVRGGPFAAGRKIKIETTPNASESDGDGYGSSAGPQTAFALACDDWEPAKAIARRTTGFAGRVRVDVDLPPLSSDFGVEQRKAIRQAVLDSAALWAAACRECRADQLTAVSNDGTIFVRDSLARWLTHRRVDAVRRDPPATERSLLEALQNRIYIRAGDNEGSTPRVRQLEPYVANSELTGSIAAFCELKPDMQVTPTLASVHRALCEPAKLEPRARAKIQVRFRPDGRTYCGNDKEIIACRADSVLTEFNSRDFQFRLPGQPSVVTERGRRVEIDFLPVLVHEMGHWIGLQHLDRGESIMASSAERARCIDEATISRLLQRIEVHSQPAAFRLHKSARARRGFRR